VPALGDTDYTGEQFSVRREALAGALADALPPVYLTPATTDAGLAQVWFSQFEGAGLDGLIAKPLSGSYQPDKRAMFKIKHERTADCVVAGYRPHKSGADAVGSLLLGLYNDDGNLASVGVIGAFPMATRRALLTELAPLVTTFDGHPWNWAAQRGRAPGTHAGRNPAAEHERPVVRPAASRARGRGSGTTTWRAPGSGTKRSSCWRPDRAGSAASARLEEPVSPTSPTSWQAESS
jgi:ATP-dependent DNA ligase